MKDAAPEGSAKVLILPAAIFQRRRTGSSRPPYLALEAQSLPCMKDAAQDMAQDVAQNVVEDVSSAAENGSVKALIFPIAIFQRRRTGSSRPSPMGTRRWLASGACA